jgi:hypothetical protein
VENMSELFLFLALVLSLGLNALQMRLNHKEKKEILTKFMAKSLAEAEYYEKEYPKDVKVKEKKLKTMAEKKLSPLEIETRLKAEEY